MTKIASVRIPLDDLAGDELEVLMEAVAPIGMNRTAVARLLFAAILHDVAEAADPAKSFTELMWSVAEVRVEDDRLTDGQ